MSRWLFILLFTMISTVSFGQTDEPAKEDVKTLSVDEIRELIVGKTLLIKNPSNITCRIQLASGGNWSSLCTDGTGSGTYEIGMFNASGDTEGKTRPRYCLRFKSNFYDMRCTMVYKRKDGTFWVAGNKSKLEIVD